MSGNKTALLALQACCIHLQWTNYWWAELRVVSLSLFLSLFCFCVCTINFISSRLKQLLLSGTLSTEAFEKILS